MSGLGACAGLILYTGAQHAKKRLGLFPNASFNRNTAMLAVFSSFALGTFLFSSSTGKEEVYKLHPVFRVGANDNNPHLPDEQEAAAAGVNINKHPTVDRDRLQHNRMTRRKTLMDSIQRGRGFSDAHSGRWVEENSETKFRKE
jgi:hypothetical protein